MISNHAPSASRSSLQGPARAKLAEPSAERRGFEPLVPSRAHLISNQAPSASRSSLRQARWPTGGLLSRRRVPGQGSAAHAAHRSAVISKAMRPLSDSDVATDLQSAVQPPFTTTPTFALIVVEGPDRGRTFHF